MTTRKKTSSQPIARRAALVLGVAAASAAVLGARAAHAKKSKQAGEIKVTVLYGAPKSPDDFEKYYAETHMPMVYKTKGIKHIELAKPLPGPDGKPPAFYRVTELWFSNMKQFQAVTGSPGWGKVVADVPNFASGGATIIVSTVE